MARSAVTTETKPGLPAFDFAAPAEIFMRRGNARGWAPLTYRRFATGAEAIAFVLDELPARFQSSVIMEAQDQRFGHHEIEGLRARYRAGQ